MKPLIPTLMERVALDLPAQEALTDSAIPTTFVSGQHLLIPGEVQSRIYFIEQGAVMSHCQNEAHKHVNWFATEGDFVASVHSFHHQQPAGEYLTACTDVQAVAISKADHDALLEKHPALSTLAFRSVLHYLQQSERRMQHFHMLDAYDRYRHFVEERPDLAQQLPNKLIALYLGMTRFTLSKIRRLYRDKGGVVSN